VDGKPILVTGASGVLGWSLCRHLRAAGISVVGTYYTNCPTLTGVRFERVALERARSTAEFFREHSFAAVVHAAAIANPDQCERDPDLAWAVNVEGTRAILEQLSTGSRFVYISTDLVFDGSVGMYREEDPPSPINCYGETKLQAEQHVLENENAIVVRIGKLYSDGSPFHPCFSNWMRERFESGRKVPLFKDQYRTPIFVGDIARAVEVIIRSQPRAGLYHLGGPERLSRLDFGNAFAEEFGFDVSQIEPVSSVESGLTRRGGDCSLDSSKFYREYEFTPLSLKEGLKRLRREWGKQSCDDL